MDSDDDFFTRACQVVRDQGTASNNQLQRALGIGTGRARSFLARMVAIGLISEPDPMGRRTVNSGAFPPTRSEPVNDQNPPADGDQPDQNPPDAPIDGLTGLSDYDRAVTVVRSYGKCSTSFVQRHTGLGYNAAAALIERMEAEGIVTKANDVGKREVVGGFESIADQLHPTDAQEAAAERETADEVLSRPHNVQMPGSNMVSGDELRAFFERVEKVRGDKAKLAEVEKSIFAEVKSRGFDAAIFRNVLKMRAQTPSAREEQIAITELYLAAIGMASEPPMMRMMAGMGVDPAVKESVIAAIKMIVPMDGEIMLRGAGVALSFRRNRDGVTVGPIEDHAAAAPVPDPDPATVDDDPIADATSEQARAMGVEARKDDTPIVRNPFPFGDVRRREWDQGWREQDGGNGFGEP